VSWWRRWGGGDEREGSGCEQRDDAWQMIRIYAEAEVKRGIEVREGDVLVRVRRERDDAVRERDDVWEKIRLFAEARTWAGVEEGEEEEEQVYSDDHSDTSDAMQELEADEDEESLDEKTQAKDGKGAPIPTTPSKKRKRVDPEPPPPGKSTKFAS